ncbi:hypothetical protein [Desulfovibrio oxyclinae]|jgi:hypothetical protein|nr:hypothetical protein [Desulfovibrio oxyclinae]
MERRLFLRWLAALPAVLIATPVQAGKKKVVITGKGGKVTDVKEGSDK